MSEKIENKPPVICLRSYPDGLFKIISKKKQDMIEKCKRHVSWEMAVISILKENIK